MRPLLSALLCAPLLALPAPALAEIYKYYDADGNLVLSDVVPKDHPEKAEKLAPRPVMTVPAVAPTGRRGRVSEGAAAGERSPRPGATDYAIVIQSPAADATYRHGGESIPVAVSTDPALQSGHHLQLLLDGESVDGTAALSPDSLDRGAHTLTARIVDAGGKVLKSVGVTFYVQQHSVLQPPAGKPGKPGRPAPGQP